MNSLSSLRLERPLGATSGAKFTGWIEPAGYSSAVSHLLHSIPTEMLLFGKTGSSRVRDKKTTIQFALLLLLISCVPSHPFAKIALRKGQKIISHLYLSVNISQRIASLISPEVHFWITEIQASKETVSSPALPWHLRSHTHELGQGTAPDPLNKSPRFSALNGKITLVSLE